MQNPMYVDISLKIDKSELYINDKANIQVEITNNSDLKVENGLLRIMLDESIFKILDDTVKPCINDFGSTGDIEAGKSVCVNIPVEVKKLPKTSNSWITGIGSSLNFHVIENNSLRDFNVSSEELLVEFFEVNVIDNDNFRIRSMKKQVQLDEDIHYEIFIKNEGKIPIVNLIVSDFIGDKTKLIQNSFVSSLPEKTALSKDKFLIKDLKAGEDIFLNFAVAQDDINKSCVIENKAKLKYIDKSGQIIDLDSNSESVNISTKNLFDDSNFTYTIDKNEARVNDFITHTIYIKNDTDTITRNVYVQSNLMDELEFVPNSLVVNSIHRIDESITENIILGELEPSESFLITYKTRVVNFFNESNLNINLTYNTPKRKFTSVSNDQSLKVMTSILSKENFVKTTNKDSYSTGEVIEFKIEVLNEGNTPALNVLLKDTLNPSLEFVESSVFVNNYRVEENIFENGIVLDKINPNQKIIVNYKAKAINANKEFKNCASLTYSQDTDKDDEVIFSNDVAVKILGSKIGEDNFIKEISTDTTQVGDIISVRLFIENQGTLDCESIKIYEPVNHSLEFVEGSLRVNKQERLDENIFDGVMITKLKENENITLTYQLKVLDFPKPNPIDDRAVLNYTCVYNDKMETKTIYSTKSKLYVNNPELEVIDKNSFFGNNEMHKYCHYKDLVFYNLKLENVGNVGLENLQLNFNFPKDLTIDFETLKINNALYNKKVDNNISLPNLNVSQTLNLEFYAKHDFISDYNLESFINLSYTFKDLRSKEIFKKSKRVKENVIIIDPNIEITKLISDKDIEINKEFTENIHIKNTGNIKLKDLFVDLNENEFLKSCNRTVFVNGNYFDYNNNLVIDYLNINESVNIVIRYNIVEMPSFDNIISESEVSATYQFSDDYLPIKIKRKSNKVTLDITNCFLDIRGKCNSKVLELDEVYTYMFKVSNIGNVNCVGLNFVGEIPDYIKYVEDSFKINNKKVNAKKIDSSINLGELNYNETLNITFDFIVRKLPYNKQATINASIESKYYAEKELLKKKFRSDENILQIENIDLDIVKTTSSESLQSGETTKIQTIINNIGSVDVYNLLLTDNHENNFSFVEDSVYIDGENIPDLDPTMGIEIKKLPAGKNLLITYEYDYLPKLYVNKLVHYSNLQYTYNLMSKKEKTTTIKSNSLYIEGALSTFKQFSVESEYRLKEYEPNIGEIVSIISDAVIDDYYEINNLNNKQLDSSSSSVRKVILKGSVMNRIEYFTGNGNSSLYMLEIAQRFTSFVNLPMDYDFEDLYFKAKCDDTFYKTVSDRGMFLSSLVSIEGLM